MMVFWKGMKYLKQLAKLHNQFPTHRMSGAFESILPTINILKCQRQSLGELTHFKPFPSMAAVQPMAVETHFNQILWYHL